MIGVEAADGTLKPVIVAKVSQTSHLQVFSMVRRR